ncbi:MAG: hypothetical protein KJ905_02135 [Nanoarchaeota archaeon]|nr:hypothetical protein [Nanoarchaeota archaeon]
MIEKENKFKEIKVLTDEEMGLFSKHFSEPNSSIVPTTEFPEFLTNSEVLKQTTVGAIHLSGAIVVSGCDNSHMGTELIRYDAKEEANGGYPFNMDRYFITDDNPRRLLKEKSDFEGHKLDSLPKPFQKAKKSL